MTSPRPLPGLYFDPVRKRYFAGTAPKATSDDNNNAQATRTPDFNEGAHKGSKCQTATHEALATSRCNGLYHSNHIRLQNQVTNNQYACTSGTRGLELPQDFGPDLRALAVSPDAKTYVCADDKGLVWSYHANALSETSSGPFRMDPWREEMELRGEITSIRLAGQRYIATCLHTVGCVILVGSASEEYMPGATFFLTARVLKDIWDSHFDGTSVSLAIKGGIAHLSSLSDLKIDVREFDMDAMSIYRRQEQIYTGFRNGTVFRTDLRVPGIGTDLLYKPSASPVINVALVGEFELLAARMNGELHLYDTRWLSSKRGIRQRLLSYPGHVNSHSRSLGLAYDEFGRYLFAAGEDRRIRGWNMRTGCALSPPSPSHVADRSFLLGMQTEDITWDMCLTSNPDGVNVLHVPTNSMIRTFELGRFELEETSIGRCVE